MGVEDINIRMNVHGEPVEIGVSVPSEPVKLRRMLPLLRQMSNGFVGAAVDQVRAGGKEISCRAGCGACCRQLVPVSEVEAFELRELVDSMPEPRRSEIRERFASGAARLRDAGYFERLDLAARESEAAYAAMVNEYFEFGVACPFLENESCSIHADRPITCREYLVTSPPAYCASAEGTGVQTVRQIFELKEALISTSRVRTAEELPYVPMISVLEWTDTGTDDAPARTGREWMSSLFERMMEIGNRNETA
jgi:Fe-S-cluster containining protein